MEKNKYRTFSSISFYFSIFFIILSIWSELLMLFVYGMDMISASPGKPNPPIWDFFAYLTQLTCISSLPVSILLLMGNIILRKKNKYLLSGLLILPTIFINIIPYIFAIAMIFSGIGYYS